MHLAGKKVITEISSKFNPHGRQQSLLKGLEQCSDECQLNFGWPATRRASQWGRGTQCAGGGGVPSAPEPGSQGVLTSVLNGMSFRTSGAGQSTIDAGYQQRWVKL